MSTPIYQLAPDTRFSRDYEKLADLMQQQSVICVVDYKFRNDPDNLGIARDVAQTIFYPTRWTISARGISYVYAQDRASFIQACTDSNVEWLEPTPEPAPRRRFVLNLRLSADTRDDMVWALYQISREMERNELSNHVASGSPSSGFTLEWSEDESVTHDSYFAAIESDLTPDSSPLDPSSLF